MMMTVSQLVMISGLLIVGVIVVNHPVASGETSNNVTITNSTTTTQATASSDRCPALLTYLGGEHVIDTIIKSETDTASKADINMDPWGVNLAASQGINERITFKITCKNEKQLALVCINTTSTTGRAAAAWSVQDSCTTPIPKCPALKNLVGNLAIGAVQGENFIPLNSSDFAVEHFSGQNFTLACNSGENLAVACSPVIEKGVMKGLSWHPSVENCAKSLTATPAAAKSNATSTQSAASKQAATTGQNVVITSTKALKYQAKISARVRVTQIRISRPVLNGTRVRRESVEDLFPINITNWNPDPKSPVYQAVQKTFIQQIVAVFKKAGLPVTEDDLDMTALGPLMGVIAANYTATVQSDTQLDQNVITQNVKSIVNQLQKDGAFGPAFGEDGVLFEVTDFSSQQSGTTNNNAGSAGKQSALAIVVVTTFATAVAAMNF